MKNSLKTLERIQKFNIDEQRKILTARLEDEERLLHELDRLNKDFAREKAFSAAHPGVGDFGAFTKQYIKKRELLEEDLRRVRRQISEIRDIIAEMFKEQKTYEIVDDNRQKRRRRENELKDQKMLDEIGTNAYIKRKKSS